MKTHEPDYKPLKCAECDKEFTSKKGHNNHMIMVHKMGEPSFRCSFCAYTANKRYQMVRHIEKNHSNEDYVLPGFQRNYQFLDERGKVIPYENLNKKGVEGENCDKDSDDRDEDEDEDHNNEYEGNYEFELIEAADLLQELND